MQPVSSPHQEAVTIAIASLRGTQSATSASIGESHTMQTIAGKYLNFAVSVAGGASGGARAASYQRRSW
jgi:hypothetical protein